MRGRSKLKSNFDSTVVFRIQNEALAVRRLISQYSAKFSADRRDGSAILGTELGKYTALKARWLVFVEYARTTAVVGVVSSWTVFRCFGIDV